MSATTREGAASGLTAALLAQGRLIHRLSFALTLLSLVGAAVFAQLPGFLPVVLLVGAVLAGALGTFFAMRVGFDAEVFQMVAAGEMDWAGVDQGLGTLRLVPQGHGTRSEESRTAGALRLLRRQAGLAALQVLLLLAAFLEPAWFNLVAATG